MGLQADESLALVQHQACLYLVDMARLSHDLFYQQVRCEPIRCDVGKCYAGRALDHAPELSKGSLKLGCAQVWSSIFAFITQPVFSVEDYFCQIHASAKEFLGLRCFQCLVTKQVGECALIAAVHSCRSRAV